MGQWKIPDKIGSRNENKNDILDTAILRSKVYWDNRRNSNILSPSHSYCHLPNFPKETRKEIFPPVAFEGQGGGGSPFSPAFQARGRALSEKRIRPRPAVAQLKQPRDSLSKNSLLLPSSLSLFFPNLSSFDFS